MHAMHARPYASEERRAALETRLRLTVGLNLSRAHDASDLRTLDVLNALGIERTHFNRWKRGKVLPGPGYLAMLAEIYGVNVGWFFDDHTADTPVAA